MTIRQYTKNDEKFIIDICFNTRGDYIVDSDDSYLFSLRWAQCYLRFFPEYCFVAEDEGEVIGYTLSAPDTDFYEKTYLKHILPEIESLISPDDKYYDDFVTFLSIRNMVSDKADQFPAHMHINLTPKCQSKGIGSKLIKAMEENLIKRGVKGIHLGVMAENHKAINFYKKHNYSIFTKYEFGEGNWGYFMGKNFV